MGSQNIIEQRVLALIFSQTTLQFLEDIFSVRKSRLLMLDLKQCQASFEFFQNNPPSSSSDGFLKQYKQFGRIDVRVEVILFNYLHEQITLK